MAREIASKTMERYPAMSQNQFQVQCGGGSTSGPIVRQGTGQIPTGTLTGPGPADR